jgi:SAM-dependent methyltransferase
MHLLALGRITKTVLAIVAGAILLQLIVEFGLRMLLSVKQSVGRPLSPLDRVILRYQKQPMSAWMFAWFKIRLDPMFRELPGIVEKLPKIQTFLDLGCGLGVAGSFLLETLEGTKVYGIDPSRRRVLGANRAFADRGEAFVGAAPDFEVFGLPNHFDAVIMLDVTHFLPDAALAATLKRIRAKLDENGSLIIRAIVPPAGGGTLLWKIDTIDRAIKRIPGFHRPVEQLREAIACAGFHVEQVEMSGGNPEMFWFVASAASGGQSGETAPPSAG